MMKPTTALVLVLLVFISSPNLAQTGLVAHWPLDGNANDASGNGYHGVVQGATATTDRFGTAGGAYALDGTDDYIDVSAVTAATSQIAAHTGTISMWFKAASDLAAGNLFGVRNTSGPLNQTWLWIGHGTNYSGSESLTWHQEGCILAAYENGHMFFMDDAWHHVAVVMGTDFNQIYIDGQPVSIAYLGGTGSASSGACLWTPEDYLVLIGSGGEGTNSFKGSLDDVRIYDQPLSGQQVADLFSAGCTTPGSFTTSAPPNAATGVSTSPTLSWNGSSGAGSYEVYFGTSNPPPLVTTTTSTSYTPQALANATTYYWKITALASCDSSLKTNNSGDVQSFTTSAVCDTPGAFALLTPPDGASDTSTTPTLSWDASSGAGSYEVYLGTSNPPPLVTTTASNTYAPSALLNGQTYYWKVTAIASCDSAKKTTNSGGVRAFQTIQSCPTGNVSLLTPADGAEFESPVTLSWESVERAANYRVWASIDNGAITLLGEPTTGSLTVEVESGTVSWFVEAMIPSCKTLTSASRQFVVKKAVTCPSTAPDPQSPASGSTNVASPVSFSWQGVEGAIRYKVWISVDGVPFQDLLTTAETNASIALVGKSVSWFVEAVFPGCPSTKSGFMNFDLQPTDPCSKESPALLSPVSQTTQTGLVLFQWSAVQRASEYRVWLVTSEGSKPSHLGTTRALELKKQVSAGNHLWYVEAIFESCPSTRSTQASFTVPEPPTCEDNSVPSLTSPADHTTTQNTRVTFRWNAVERALGYRLWSRRNGGAVTSLGETTVASELEVVLPSGEIVWWVEAFFTGCPSIESERRTLTVLQAANCNRRTPFLLNPKDGAGNLTSPIRLTWTAVGKAQGYEVWQRHEGGPDELVASVPSGSTARLIDTASGSYEWWVVAKFDDCDPVSSPRARFSTIAPPTECAVPEAPVASGIGEVTSGERYRIFWTAVPGARLYEIEESTFANFAENKTSRVVEDLDTEYSNTASGTTPYYYRVRAIADCDQRKSPFSKIVEVRIINDGANMELGNLDLVSEQIEICTDGSGAVIRCSGASSKNQFGLRTPITYDVAADQDWMTVSPETIDIEPGGRAVVTLTSDPGELDLGTNQATVTVSRADGGKAGISNDGATVPVSTSLVTPVSPQPKTSPPPDSIMLLAAAHSTGLNSFWQSDLRLANVGSQPQKYDITFVTAGQDGTEKARQVTTQASPGQTIAFNDLLRTLYGQGSIPSENVLGTLEIRPVSSEATFGAASGATQTIATSRTYNLTTAGTYGQFIPGIEFGEFIGKDDGVLTLQHIESSTDARTNFGFVEGSGEPATIQFELFDAGGTSLGSVIYGLQPGEFRQIPVLRENSIQIEDGRAEISVVSNTGRVMAYAAVNDNLSGDPFLVLPNELFDTNRARYVVPGVATIDTGQALWKSDMRIYNSSAEVVDATITFFMQNDPSTSSQVQIALQPGETRILDDVLVRSFGLPSGSGGVLHIESVTGGSLGITTRTYNQTEEDGTYGQFIPAFTEADSIGVGDSSLQILQIEQSEQFRTNLGLTEIYGSSAIVEISAILPGTAASAVATVELAGNQFTQLNSILAQMGMSRAKNVRLQIRVVEGEGRVVAYASVIDNSTQDPTYVPAQ